MRLLQVDLDHPIRAAVESIVRIIYADEYGATLATLPERMLAGIDDTGRVACVAGLRTAPFFSEVYLDAPVEQTLSRLTGAPVARDSVVEVTSLAAAQAGSAVAFTRSVISFCADSGFEWAFFTATSRLRVLLRRSRISFLRLVSASAECVDDPDAWGSYYRQDPVVCAVHRSMLVSNAAAGSPVARELSYA